MPNVGIGTTAPSAPLEVNGQILASAGTIATPGFAFSGQPNTGIFSGGVNSLNFSIGGVNTVQIGQSLLQSNAPVSAGNGSSPSNPAFRFLTAGFGMYNPSDQNLAFSTNSLERMRIASDGSVGIGTAVPTAPLSVVGSQSGSSLGVLSVQNTYTGSNNNAFTMTSPNLPTGTRTYFNLGVANSANNWISEGFYYAGAGSSNNRLDYIFHSGSSPVISLVANGNVGIGTTAPVQKLTVNGSLGITGASGTATIAPSTLSVGNVFSGETWLSSSGSQSFDPGSGVLATAKVVQSTGGSTPAATFAAGVSGTYTADTYAGYFNNTSTQSSGTQYGIYAIGANNYFSGKVGVGTAAPQATLDLNGYMRMKANAAAPAACSSTNDNALAVTSRHTLCICNGSTNAWVSTNDGSTACTW